MDSLDADYDSLTDDILSHPRVVEDIGKVLSYDRNTLNLVAHDWREKMAVDEKCRTWCDDDKDLPLVLRSGKQDSMYDIYGASYEDTLPLFVAGKFYYQRSVFKNSTIKKEKDENRLEYFRSSAPLEHLKARVAHKMGCAPLHMMLLFATACHNQCSECKNVPNLPRDNKFCLKFMKLYDGDEVRPISSAYMDVYLSAVPFMAVAKISVDTAVVLRNRKECKLTAKLEYMIVIPDYAVKRYQPIDPGTVLIPFDCEPQPPAPPVEEGNAAATRLALPASFDNGENELLMFKRNYYV